MKSVLFMVYFFTRSHVYPTEIVRYIYITVGILSIWHNLYQLKPLETLFAQIGTFSPWDIFLCNDHMFAAFLNKVQTYNDAKCGYDLVTCS